MKVARFKNQRKEKGEKRKKERQGEEKTEAGEKEKKKENKCQNIENCNRKYRVVIFWSEMTTSNI